MSNFKCSHFYDLIKTQIKFNGTRLRDFKGLGSLSAQLIGSKTKLLFDKQKLFCLFLFAYYKYYYIDNHYSVCADQ